MVVVQNFYPVVFLQPKAVVTAQVFENHLDAASTARGKTDNRKYNRSVLARPFEGPRRAAADRAPGVDFHPVELVLRAAVARVRSNHAGVGRNGGLLGLGLQAAAVVWLELASYVALSDSRPKFHLTNQLRPGSG